MAYVDIFNHMAEKEFRAKAFGNYCEARAENFQRIFPALTAMVDSVPDDDEQTRDADPAETAANQVLSDYGLNGSEYLALESGFVNLKDLLKARYNSVVGDIEGDEENDSFADMIPTFASNGTAINPISVTTALDEIKTSYHATCATAAALLASYGESVQEKLTLFRDKMSEKFQNAYSDYSSIASSLVSALKDNCSPLQMFNQVRSLIGVEKLAEEEIDTAGDTDFSQYSGASPVCALCFDNVISGAVSVITATAKVVAGVVAGIGRAVGKIFSWLGSKVHEIVVDPYDIEEIDSKINSYTIDGFQWQVHNASSGFNAYIVDAQYEPTEQEWTELAEYLQGMIGKWVKYKTVVSEHLFRINEVQYYYQEDAPAWSSITVKYDEVYKLKPITREAVNNFLNTKTDLEQYDSWTVKAHLNTDDVEVTGFDNVSSLYYNTGDSEIDLYKGFVYSAFVLQFFAGYASGTIEANKGSTNTLNLTDPISNFIDESYWPNSVSNADFIYCACGYTNGDISSETTPFYSSHLFDWIRSINPPSTGGCSRYFTSFIVNKIEQKIYPLDYPFLPYLTEVEGFEESRFKIKTDSQNQGAFSKFMTVVIVVAIVAAVAVTALVVAKKISRAIKIRRIAAQGRMDNAMWNGEVPTGRQARKYFRLVRKNSGSDAVTSGLLSNTFEMLTDKTNGTENFDNILKVIKP